MESAEFIQWCLDNLNYWTITLLMIIESSFIPFPSEIVVPPAAYIAASDGSMNIYLIILFATLGADIGALVNYYLAKWLGRPLVYRFANSRLGHLCLIDEEKVRHSENYFNKHGIISTVIGRLVPAVRQLISIPAGLARMKLSVFLIYTTIGAGIWNCILAFIGYQLEKVVPREELMEKVNIYSSQLGWVFVFAAIACVIYLIINDRRKRALSKTI